MMASSRDNAIHRVWLDRLLRALLEWRELSDNLGFKGGSCAAMLGYLDRFSVDLDFDLRMGKKDVYREGLLEIFADLGLGMKDESQEALHFVLKYQNEPNKRNTLRLEITDNPPKNNEYEKMFLVGINRYAWCQTRATMVANKLVALLDRWERHHKVVARDVYDIHHFLIKGYEYSGKIVEERTGMEVRGYLRKLADFIEDKLTRVTIDEDLNYLLSPEQFKVARKVLKEEVVALLRREAEGVK